MKIVKDYSDELIEKEDLTKAEKLLDNLGYSYFKQESKEEIIYTNTHKFGGEVEQEGIVFNLPARNTKELIFYSYLCYEDPISFNLELLEVVLLRFKELREKYLKDTLNKILLELEDNANLAQGDIINIDDSIELLNILLTSYNKKEF